ncbi:MAG TPA: copper-binding protein [Xanthobacteraceae bacterium]|nr:copper-binding protein [Xanthobacteraceae bacterium]
MRTIARVSAIAISIIMTTVPNAARAQADLIDGQVTRIDKSTGKITLRHGAMKKFDLESGHTMVFRVRDPAALEQVKVGDKVKFEADRVNGQFTVIKFEKVR